MITEMRLKSGGGGFFIVGASPEDSQRWVDFMKAALPGQIEEHPTPKEGAD